MIDLTKLKKRFDYAVELRRPKERIYEEAMDYASPSRQVFNTQGESESRRNGNHVFDGTTEDALDNFVSNFQSSMVPPGRQWINLKAGPLVENKDEANRQLETITKTLFSALKRSNFDTQISECLYDYSLGVGSLMVNKGTVENPFEFRSVSIGNLYLEEGPMGKPDTRYRKSEVPYAHLQELWPDLTMPEDWVKGMEEDAYKKVTIVECFLGNSDIEKYDTETGERISAKGLHYVVVDSDFKYKLVDRQQESDPFIVFRCPTAPGEVWARGQLVKVIKDVKTLNKAKELLLKKGSRDMYGVYTYLDDGVLNLDNLQFGGETCFIPVESNGGARGASISALPPAGDLNLSQFIFADLQQTIRSMLFADPLGDVNLPVRSATEHAYRQQAYAKRTGSSYGRIMNELIIPLINRLLHILEELGLINLSGIRVEDGKNISLEYVSPLASAQDAEKMVALSNHAQFIVGMYGEIGLSLVPADKVMKLSAEYNQIPREAVPTDEEINAFKQALLQRGIQQGMAEQAASQQQAQQPLPEAA